MEFFNYKSIGFLLRVHSHWDTKRKNQTSPNKKKKVTTPFACILGLRITVVLDIIRHSTDPVYVDSQRADLLHGTMEAG